MAQLRDLRDIENLETRGLDEIISEAFQPSRFNKWKKEEERLIKEGKAPSLSAYLIYEYQINGKSTQDLAREFNCSISTLDHLFKKIGIPKKTIAETRVIASEENKKKIAEKIRQELRNYKLNPKFELTKNQGIMRLLGLSIKTYTYGILKDYLTQEELKQRATIIHKQNAKKSQEQGIGIYSLTEEQKADNSRNVAAILKERRIGIYNLSKKQLSEAGKVGGNKMVNEKMGIHGFSREKRQEIGRRSAMNSLEKGTGMFSLTHKERSDMAIKSIQKSRKKRYFVENRFYADSQQEGAIALLIEDYILGKGNIKTEENFQIQNRGLKCGGIDFLVNGEFLEWHPIRMDTDPIKEEKILYKELKDCITDKIDQKIYQGWEDEFKKELANRYFTSRKTNIDNSGYAGAKLTLATNMQELYDFISKYSEKLRNTDYKIFEREFNQKVKYVKSFKVEPKSKNKSKLNYKEKVA